MGMLCESKGNKKDLTNENNNNLGQTNNPTSSQISQNNNSQIQQKTSNNIIKESIKSTGEKSNQNEIIPSALKSQNNNTQISEIKNSTNTPLNNMNSQNQSNIQNTQVKTSNIENPVESRVLSTIKSNTSRMNNYINFTCAKSFKAHNDSISDIIELNSGYVATGSYDKTINIWDLNNSSPINTVNISGRVFCLLEFSPGILLIMRN